MGRQSDDELRQSHRVEAMRKQHERIQAMTTPNPTPGFREGVKVADGFVVVPEELSFDDLQAIGAVGMEAYRQQEYWEAIIERIWTFALKRIAGATTVLPHPQAQPAMRNPQEEIKHRQWRENAEADRTAQAGDVERVATDLSFLDALEEAAKFSQKRRDRKWLMEFGSINPENLLSLRPAIEAAIANVLRTANEGAEGRELEAEARNERLLYRVAEIAGELDDEGERRAAAEAESAGLRAALEKIERSDWRWGASSALTTSPAESVRISGPFAQMARAALATGSDK